MAIKIIRYGAEHVDAEAPSKEAGKVIHVQVQVTGPIASPVIVPILANFPGGQRELGKVRIPALAATRQLNLSIRLAGTLENVPQEQPPPGP